MATDKNESQQQAAINETGKFPDIVLLKIFSNLSIHDLGRACLVCKQWENVFRSDVIWKRFVPKWPWFEPPAKTQGAFQIVRKLWKKKCVNIGNERWLPNPMPELVKYDKRLRKAELHNYYERCSSATLIARLNPCYEFTTKGKDAQDETMNKICEEIWNGFGGKDENALEIESYQDLMRLAEFKTRKHVMTKILKTLEPHWFLHGLGLEAYALDKDDDIINGGGRNQDEWNEEEEGEDLGDVEVSAHESIFGSYSNKTAWRSKVNKRLPVELYRKIKAFFADGSEHFIEYYLSSGCFNENFEYAYSMFISDTAVFHIKQFYEL